MIIERNNMEIKNRRIYWWGSFTDFGGYAYMNRNYVRNLHNRGWDVKIAAIKTNMEISMDELRFLKSITASKKTLSHVGFDRFLKKPIRIHTPP